MAAAVTPPDPPRPETDGSPVAPPRDFRLDPGDRFGGYRIVRRLGYGGTSEVYLAEEVALNRRVALKIFLDHGHLGPGFLERFSREAKAAAAILHPNVVTLFASGKEAGHLFMAFEYVPGGDLAHHYEQGPPLAEKEGLCLLFECARGLQALDEVGLVHRDIKPHNIFLGEEGQAKLGDLGLARSTRGDDSLTITGTVLGTPAFMSPEQALAKQALDIRSDIYSLGSTFFALLTGRLPFQGETPFAITYRIIGDQVPPRARTVRTDLSLRVECLLMRMMDPVPDKRFQTPAALQEAVAACADSPGPEPESPLTALGERPAWQLAGFVLALLLPVLAGFGFWALDPGGPAGATDAVSGPAAARDDDDADAGSTSSSGIDGDGRDAGPSRPEAAAADEPRLAAVAADMDPEGLAPPAEAADAADPASGRWRISAGRDHHGRWLRLQLGYAVQRFRWIGPGHFRMGSPSDEAGRSGNETPHRVLISTGFWLGETECPQTLWEAVTGGNPAEFRGGGRPVDSVSWHDSQDFCRRLAAGIDGLTVRLPSEAEWEYACRAGGDGPFGRPCTGEAIDRFANLADVSSSSEYRRTDLDDGVGDESAAAGSLRPNAFGIHDMHGNLWEWCADGYQSDLGSGQMVDPVITSGLTRVRRGGGWQDLPEAARAASRQGSNPATARSDIGFRLVLESVPAAENGFWQGR